MEGTPVPNPVSFLPRSGYGADRGPTRSTFDHPRPQHPTRMPSPFRVLPPFGAETGPTYTPTEPLVRTIPPSRRTTPGRWTFNAMADSTPHLVSCVSPRVGAGNRPGSFRLPFPCDVDEAASFSPAKRDFVSESGWEWTENGLGGLSLLGAAAVPVPCLPASKLGG